MADYESIFSRFNVALFRRALETRPSYDDTITDHTKSVPDECLALIFKFLKTTEDQNNFSLVSHRWLQIDAQTRTHLTLDARSDLRPFIRSIFTRFNSVNQLVLRNNRTRFSGSIKDDDIILITSMCPNLTRLKLVACEGLTDSGMAAFSRNCKNLKEFSCVWCPFSDLGMFELLDNCSELEVLYFSGLFNSTRKRAPARFRTGAAAKKLKVIKFMNVFADRLTIPFISCFKNLKTLKVISCRGKWDRMLERIPNCLCEVYLEQANVTDVGVSSLAKCCDLTTLHIEKSQCTDVGLISVAENCRALKKLCVDNCASNRNRIGDTGLIAVGMHSVNLQELVLKGVSVSSVSLRVIATNCENLVRLELCKSETITDEEMIFIAENFIALKFLCIEECSVSNIGIMAFAFPNMVNIRVTKCEKLTRGIKKWLKARRKLIARWTNTLNASTSDSRVQEHVVEVPPANHEAFTERDPVSATSSSFGNGGPTSIFNDSS